jgi:hypothetical protein
MPAVQLRCRDLRPGDILLKAREDFGFVTYVYQFVAEQSGVQAERLFNFSDSKAPPSTLAAALARHPMFSEAGYLLPGER